jgi:hypothetical protein
LVYLPAIRGTRICRYGDRRSYLACAADKRRGALRKIAAGMGRLFAVFLIGAGSLRVGAESKAGEAIAKRRPEGQPDAMPASYVGNA